jgi:hypothetical protein
MEINMQSSVRNLILKFVLPALTVLALSAPTFAGGDKTTICHIPPDDPDNVQIMELPEKAAANHIAEHGDELYNATDEICEAVVTCPCIDQYGKEEGLIEDMAAHRLNYFTIETPWCESSIYGSLESEPADTRTFFNFGFDAGGPGHFCFIRQDVQGTTVLSIILGITEPQLGACTKAIARIEQIDPLQVCSTD